MKSSRFALFVQLMLTLALAIPAFAQSDRGTITGTVTDPNGALVPNARVIATNLESGEVREATTTDQGSYTLPELRAGRYRLRVEAPQGFRTSTVDEVAVAVQVTRRVDVTLEAGQIGEVVTVTSEASVIQADTPVRQTNVTQRQVRELPLQVSAESGGRTPLAFIFLDSNVTGTGGGVNASNFRVSGGQGLGTEILIDGAPTRRAQNGTFFSEVAPGPNAFQEFTLSTSTFSAEFGQTSGGIVNFTIRSGGNELHGEGYEYFRNEALNANSFLRNAQGFTRPERDHQHNFGFNVGGPIYLPRVGEGGPVFLSGKDRAFFFFNYEGFRFARGESVFVSVPTDRMRTGDFSELLTDPAVVSRFGPVQLYDPTMPVGARNPIPGNRIDLYRNPAGQSIIDPVGQAILLTFPRPTRPGVYRNYLAQSSTPTTMNNYIFKLDFALTTAQRLAFSYSYRNLQSVKGCCGNPGFTRFPEPFVASGAWDQFFKSHFVRLQHDFTISPTLLNHFNAGFTRYDVANRNFTLGFNNTALGFSPNATQNAAFPLIGFPTYGDPADPVGDPRAYQGIGSTFFSDVLGDNAVQLADFMTWVKGRHTIKFGAEVRPQQFNVSQRIHPGGEFNFIHNQTANIAPGGRAPDNQGWPIASLITGATEFSFNSRQAIDPGWRQFSQSYFVQDDLKLTPRLTLNIGIRYDLPGLRYESKDRFRGFDPNTPNPDAGGRLGAIIGAGGQGGQAEHRTLARPDRSNIGPRLGFAYAFNDRTVVRGGVGVYYAPILYGFGGNNTLTEGTLGYSTPIQPNINGGADANPDLFLRSYRSVLPINPAAQFIGSDIDYFDPSFRTGRIINYSLDLQRQLRWNFAVSVGYIGHRGTRLRSDFNRVNAIPFEALRLGFPLLDKALANVTPAERAYAQSVGITLPASNSAVFTGFNGTVGQALRPFPQYGFIRNHLESQGQSWYNALQVKFDRRFAQGIQFGLSYTFSKLITDAAEDLLGGSLGVSGVVQNPYDRRAMRAVSPSSLPHVFVVNYIFELPFGKGRAFLNQSRLADFFLGGWQIGGINRYQSGLPLVIRHTRVGEGAFSGGGGGITGFGTDIRPNLTGQPILTGNAQADLRFRLVNPNAFSLPPNFRTPPTTDVTDPAYAAYYANPLRFFGDAPPVLDRARDLPFFSENLSLLKKFYITETVTFELGAEAFNLFNRHRYAQPFSDLSNLGEFGFSGIDAGYQPRVVQIRMRAIF